jgi:NAD-dependent deacetylase
MDDVIAACRAAVARRGGIVALTGAGISAESGLPTFRGKEGYWTIGSREYHPQELATRQAFDAMPWEVWAWYLYRRGVCRRATPNPGHEALVTLDAGFPDRAALVTQNVDGLHRRAGSPAARTFPIHGDIEYMRCAADCVLATMAIPEGVPDLDKGAAVPDAARALLRCGRCGALARPHVLWFDESYDEPRFHLDTARRLGGAAALLIVMGTSAQTNLPWQVVTLASRARATIVDINIEDNPFGDLAAHRVRAPAAQVLPALVAAIVSE